MGNNTGHPMHKLCGEAHALGPCPKFMKSRKMERVIAEVREIEAKPLTLGSKGIAKKAKLKKKAKKGKAK